MADDLGKSYLDKIRAPRVLTAEDEDALINLLETHKHKAEENDVRGE